MPEVGSSRSTVLLSPQNAMATESLRFMPPLRFLENVLRFSCKATSSMLWSIFSSASWADILLYIPLILAKNWTCSLTVSMGKRQSCCKQMPISCRMEVMLVRMSLPPMVAYPSVGAIIPVNMLIVVVFPAPLCPSRAVIWSLYSDMLSPSTAVFSPKVLRRLRTSMLLPWRFCALTESETSSAGMPSWYTTSSSSFSSVWELTLPGHQ
mmetsp:Transcript_23468/g.65510  ORF Transcript_23468/g.65510 Transcript_23468/m.65510 type:complete len:209 (-) Transcript_23468:2095-2721(-)